MRPLDGVDRVFRRKSLLAAASAGIVLLLAAASSQATEFSFAEGLASFPKAFSWFAANFMPDAKALRNLPKILGRLGETVMVSVMASVVAAVVAFALSILASRTTRPHPAVSVAVRLFASLCRNIPVVAWAMIFLLSFGQNVLTGFLAIFISSLGFLTRAFTETVDEAAQSSVEALRATGAPWFATIAQAVVPSVLPRITSWALYMVENNIRDATLVGILTGTGIGFLFDIYYKNMNYSSAAMVVAAIVVAVIALEMASNALRKVIS